MKVLSLVLTFMLSFSIVFSTEAEEIDYSKMSKTDKERVKKLVEMKVAGLLCPGEDGERILVLSSNIHLYMGEEEGVVYVFFRKDGKEYVKHLSLCDLAKYIPKWQRKKK